MIVDPDFLTHWRTQMLIDSLGGDQMAPLYVLRIWAHCQQRKSVCFAGMPAPGLKALCKFSGDADLLERSLIEAGFIERCDTAIEVPGWAEHNAQLIAAWVNGSKGGRKKGEPKPKSNQKQTHSEPMGYGDGTESKPEANHQVTGSQAIREEKIREEKNSSLRSERESAEFAEGTSLSPISPAAAVCRALKDEGISMVNPGHPELPALLKAGAGIPEFVYAARLAVSTGKASFPYVIGIVKGRLSEAAAPRAPPRPQRVAAEPAWRAEQRARVQQFAPSVAAKPFVPQPDFIDVEATDAVPNRLA